jgi:hypothetical protein
MMRRTPRLVKRRAFADFTKPTPNVRVGNADIFCAGVTASVP